jgi:hypothetical protein
MDDRSHYVSVRPRADGQGAEGLPLVMSAQRSIAVVTIGPGAMSNQRIPIEACRPLRKLFIGFGFCAENSNPSCMEHSRIVQGVVLNKIQ